MPGKVSFVLGIHNHQPVGNFDHVIEEAFEKAYMPFLDVMKDYPGVPFALHCSGILWDWFAGKHPEYLETVEEMISRGQAEIMSGGYYEPILTVIPERDRRGQVEMMQRYVEGRFGVRPRGCWLTERIWDPHLPDTLDRCGLEYVIVDDSHFKSTGFTADRMRGYFVSEENDHYVKVFPIDKRLRYLIPFHDPSESIAYLRAVADEPGGGGRIAVLADDGEKFGLWTGTHDLVYRRNWLRRFCEALLENSDWIELTTFSKAIDGTPPLGIVYLPTASYSEMMEWALPLRAQEIYEDARRTLEAAGRFEEPAEVLRGGFWRNFLVKYEESNWMHKRMLRASRAAAAFEDGGGNAEAAASARSHLYQAQCNCAYWHGLFGGLYLPHLRSAVFKHILEAEAAAGVQDGPPVEVSDLDGDGTEEVIVNTGELQAFFKVRGGVLRELDIMGARFNVTDTLTRREEIYHRDIGSGGEQGADPGEAVSIHNVSRSKEKGLEKKLIYDRAPRASLEDRFLGKGTPFEAFVSGDYEEAADFIGADYSFEHQVMDDGSIVLHLSRRGKVDPGGGPVDVDLSKTIRTRRGSSRLEVEYRITPREAPLSCLFAVESVFSFLAGKADDRYFELPGRDMPGGKHLASKGEVEDVVELSMIDDWAGLSLRFEFGEPVLLWRYPVETVSNSDSGFESVYQGSAVIPVCGIDSGPGRTRRFTMSIEAGRRGP